jgi:hypothetical protein
VGKGDLEQCEVQKRRLQKAAQVLERNRAGARRQVEPACTVRIDSAMNPALALVPNPTETLYPDIAWIKKNVPVLGIAKALGMRIRRGRAQCWRSSNHNHGDRDPSLCFHERRNRARCFVCDMKGGHSNIDLVIGVLAVDFGDAVRWIAERFTVPNIKAGRPLGPSNREPKPYRIDLGDDLQVLVRSGLFGQLSAAESRILVALYVFKNPETGLSHLSYQALMRYSGVAGRDNVSKALAQLQRFHAIQIHRGLRVGVTRQASTYRVTFDDEKFLALCNSVDQIRREQVACEREFRADLRHARQRSTQYMTKTGGLRSPAPPRASTPIPTQDKPRGGAPTCKGLNLSSPREPISNLTVPPRNRLIDLSPIPVPSPRHGDLERQKEILRERGFLQ